MTGGNEQNWIGSFCSGVCKTLEPEASSGVSFSPESKGTNGISELLDTAKDDDGGICCFVKPRERAVLGSRFLARMGRGRLPLLEDDDEAA